MCCSSAAMRVQTRHRRRVPWTLISRGLTLVVGGCGMLMFTVVHQSTPAPHAAVQGPPTRTVPAIAAEARANRSSSPAAPFASDFSPIGSRGPFEQHGPPPSSLVETLDWRATSGDERPG